MFNYKNITSLTFCNSLIKIEDPMIGWLLNGKIAENVVVTPSSSTQVITASGPNRYLNSVTVTATSDSSSTD